MDFSEESSWIIVICFRNIRLSCDSTISLSGAGCRLAHVTLVHGVLIAFSLNVARTLVFSLLLQKTIVNLSKNRHWVLVIIAIVESFIYVLDALAIDLEVGDEALGLWRQTIKRVSLAFDYFLPFQSRLYQVYK